MTNRIYLFTTLVFLGFHFLVTDEFYNELDSSTIIQKAILKLGGEVMSKQICSDIQRKKNLIIDSLIHLGIYKKGNKQLYELTLHELETEYQIVNPAIQDLSF